MNPETIDTIEQEPTTVELEPECDHQAGCPKHGIVEDCDPKPGPTPEEIAAAKKAAERHEYIAGLRELADLLQGHPELMLPYTGSTAPMSVIPYGRDQQRAQLAAWALALPGRKEKSEGSGQFYLTGSLRGVNVKLICSRDDVCERVVVGVDEVTEEVPDPEALAAVPKVTVTKKVERVEWKCGSVLDGDR